MKLKAGMIYSTFISETRFVTQVITKSKGDNILIFENNLFRLSGNVTAGTTFIIPSNVASLRFYSDQSYVYSGFQILWDAVD